MSVASSARDTRPSVSRVRRRKNRLRLGGAAAEAATGLALVAPALALLLVFFVTPLVLTGYMSLHDWPLFGPRRFVGGANYAEALSADGFWSAAAFTLAYTAVTTTLGIVVSIGLALLLRPAFAGRTFVRSVVFSPVTIGMAAAGLLFLTLVNPQSGIAVYLARQVGLATASTSWLGDSASAFVTLVLISLWKSVGFAMLVLIIGMDSVPEELYEAARLDGASGWATLSRITLPLIRQPFALVVLFTAVGNLLAFDQFYTLTKGGPDGSTMSLVYYLYQQGFQAFREGYAAAIAVLIAGLLLVFSVLQARVQGGFA